MLTARKWRATSSILRRKFSTIMGRQKICGPKFLQLWGNGKFLDQNFPKNSCPQKFFFKNYWSEIIEKGIFLGTGPKSPCRREGGELIEGLLGPLPPTFKFLSTHIHPVVPYIPLYHVYPYMPYAPKLPCAGIFVCTPPTPQSVHKQSTWWSLRSHGSPSYQFRGWGILFFF